MEIIVFQHKCTDVRTKGMKNSGRGGGDILFYNYINSLLYNTISRRRYIDKVKVELFIVGKHYITLLHLKFVPHTSYVKCIFLIFMSTCQAIYEF